MDEQKGEYRCGNGSYESPTDDDGMAHGSRMMDKCVSTVFPATHVPSEDEVAQTACPMALCCMLQSCVPAFCSLVTLGALLAAQVWGGLDVGSAVGLLLSGPLIKACGWPSVFYLFAGLGFLW